MPPSGRVGVYGAPHPALIQPPAGAVQLSPFEPHAEVLEDEADGAFARIIIAAPPGTLERRFVLAHALRALEAGGELTALAPKTLGGSRLARELAAFGCNPRESHRRHHRICVAARPAEPKGVAEAIKAGGPQIAPALGLWSQPGVFSWDRLDRGSAALLQSGLAFTGAGADLGCGIGVLARAVLALADVTDLLLVDADRRAIAAARRNIEDSRARFLHADLRRPLSEVGELDFIVMNPPFHDAGRRSLALGEAFIASAAAALRKGGRLRMVANAALPYEPVLASAFARLSEAAREGGYKVLEAVK